MTTGERMKIQRKEIGLSAETVASRLGVSPATIYRYENGDIDKIPSDLIAPIAEILQTTAAQLMGLPASQAGISLPEHKNIIKLVGRNGAETIKELTDAEYEKYKADVDKLPEADDL